MERRGVSAGEAVKWGECGPQVSPELSNSHSIGAGDPPHPPPPSLSIRILRVWAAQWNRHFLSRRNVSTLLPGIPHTRFSQPNPHPLGNVTLTHKAKATTQPPSVCMFHTVLPQGRIQNAADILFFFHFSLVPCQLSQERHDAVAGALPLPDSRTWLPHAKV